MFNRLRESKKILNYTTWTKKYKEFDAILIEWVKTQQHKEKQTPTAVLSGHSSEKIGGGIDIFHRNK